MLSSAAGSVFILSWGARDELAMLAGQGGWDVIAARRAEAVDRRFLATGASVAIVDARDAPDAAGAAIELLAPAVERVGAALLAIVPSAGALLDRVIAAGATHALAAPFGGEDLVRSLRLASRFVERLRSGGGARQPARAHDLPEGWTWHPRDLAARLSPALAARLGLDREQVGRRELRHLLDREGRRAAYAAVARVRCAGGRSAFAHPFGTGRIAHHLHHDAATGLISARVETLPGLMFDAPGRDPLTRLADAPSARRWLDARLDTPARDGARLFVLSIALSRLDMINAAFGRMTGDALLEMAARRIDRAAGTVAAARLVARMGGPRFLVALAYPARFEDAQAVAEAVAAALARPFIVGDRVVPVAARIGLAADEGGGEAEAILRRANAALAADAEGGAIRSRSAHDEHASAAESRLEVDLRRALDADEIDILFQPQVAMATGAVVGVEALARWRHPLRGALGAGELLAAAARSDYTLQLSEHIQRRALAQVAQWPAALSAIRIAINITAEDIARPGFVEAFLERLDAAGIPPTRVTAEITESNLIEDLAGASALLARMRATGLRVAIDDFGTGYSSLAYLKALPLDYLKIDRALAQDIVGAPRDQLVVRSVIDLARSLGLAVVAEGVETSAQLSLLAQAGCNFYQGYFFAGPLDSAALAARIAGAAGIAGAGGGVSGGLSAAAGSAPHRP